MLTQINDGGDPWQILAPIEISAQSVSRANF
jgi:hypothetical protein